jgi:hypothetical protein
VFGPGTADAIRRTDTFPHVADIMVNSMYDPRTDRVHAFEDQIGSHGGLGGGQSDAFLLWPRDFSPPTPDGSPPVGAEAVHRVLRRWLTESRGPQVPIGHVQESPSEPLVGEAFPVPDRLAPDKEG